MHASRSAEIPLWLGERRRFCDRRREPGAVLPVPDARRRAAGSRGTGACPRGRRHGDARCGRSGADRGVARGPRRPGFAARRAPLHLPGRLLRVRAARASQPHPEGRGHRFRWVPCRNCDAGGYGRSRRESAARPPARQRPSGGPPLASKRSATDDVRCRDERAPIVGALRPAGCTSPLPDHRIRTSHHVCSPLDGARRALCRGPRRFVRAG